MSVTHQDPRKATPLSRARDVSTKALLVFIEAIADREPAGVIDAVRERWFEAQREMERCAKEVKP